MSTIGRYRIVREIARSNDIVYEAVDPSMNRRVAVKELLLPPGLTGQQRRERIERFYREARAAGAMSHSNIVTIYEVGEDNGRYFIAMEFLEGQTLRQRLSVGGALPLTEVIAVAVALCDALEYAHRRGVVHRDIKPDNVHLLPGGKVKLTDFGIARILHETQLTMAGQVFGTPSYMSPEQIKGGQVDARSDVFALGILLFEMVTGRKPFHGDSVVTITYQIMNEPTPSAVGAPAALEAVIHRATSKDQANRFPSAAALREAVLAATANRTVGSETNFSRTALATGAFPGAPGMLTVQNGAPLALGMGTSAADPTPDDYARLSLQARRRSLQRFLIATLVLSGVTLGVGCMLTRAFQSFQSQSVNQQADEVYNTGADLYNKKQYEPAAERFRELRESGRGIAATRRKAREGEIYCYIELGRQARKNNSPAAAVQWFERALELTPDDKNLREELEEARKEANMPAASRQSPASNAEPSLSDRMTPPQTLASREPQVTARDFTSANDNAAQEAQGFFDRAEDAWRKGDRTSALRLWHAALAAGPGSPAAQRAQERITQATAENGLFDLGGG